MRRAACCWDPFDDRGGCARAQDTRSVWDGVYTDAQAKRGEALYFERCVRCHGPMLQGGTDGAGRSRARRSTATGTACRSARCSTACALTMPQDKPATLSRQQTADALAFIFSVEQDPGGQGGAAAPGGDAQPDSARRRSSRAAKRGRITSAAIAFNTGY